MVKKLLHRITVVWCLYGLVRGCILVNPLAFRFVKIFSPLYDDNSMYHSLPDIPWSVADPVHVLIVWFWVCLCVCVALAIIAGIHHFANWFFNTQD